MAYFRGGQTPGYGTPHSNAALAERNSNVAFEWRLSSESQTGRLSCVRSHLNTARSPRLADHRSNGAFELRVHTYHPENRLRAASARIQTLLNQRSG